MRNKKQFFFGILIFVLALIALIAIFWAIQFETSKVNKKISTPTPLPDQETPNMMLSFTPNILNVAPNGNFTANIQFDTYGNPVTSLTIVVAYDPSEVTNMRLTPIKDGSSALSYSFNLVAGTLENNPTNGTITQTFIIPKSIPAPKGRGNLARLTGKLKPGIQSATIRLSNNSNATSPKLSRVVLGKVNLEIKSTK